MTQEERSTDVLRDIITGYARDVVDLQDEIEARDINYKGAIHEISSLERVIEDLRGKLTESENSRANLSAQAAGLVEEVAFWKEKHVADPDKIGILDANRRLTADNTKLREENERLEEEIDTYMHHPHDCTCGTCE